MEHVFTRLDELGVAEVKRMRDAHEFPSNWAPHIVIGWRYRRRHNRPVRFLIRELNKTANRIAAADSKAERAFGKHHSRLDAEEKGLAATEAAIDRMANTDPNSPESSGPPGDIGN